MVYTDAQLKNLVACEKQIVESPSKDFKNERSSLRKNFTLVSTDGLYSFSCFFRQSTVFPENFSCGLDYNPKDERGSIILLRCNGMHGGTKEQPHHAYNHIHRPSAERINAGVKVEWDIEATYEYASFEQAIQFFVKHVNIVVSDRLKHFPPPSGQIDLFEA